MPVNIKASNFADFIVLFTLLAPMTLHASSYYVSKEGSDVNAGTVKAPWRTVEKVNQAGLKAGDIVHFRRGDTWPETIKPGRSGSASNPITYTDYGSGALPIFSGLSGDNCIEWYTTRSNLVFRNLHLKDCGQSNNGFGITVWNEDATSTDILIEGLTIENAERTNIYMTGVDGVRIRNNIIRNAKREHGIYLDGTLGLNDVVIEDNEIYGNADMCVQTNSNGKNRLTGVVVRRNQIYDCGAGGLNNIGSSGLVANHNLIYGDMAGIYNGCDGADPICAKGAEGGIYANNTILTTGSGWATCFSNAASVDRGSPNFAAFVNNICVHDALTGPAFEHDPTTSSQQVDRNLFFSHVHAEDAMAFVWRGTWYSGFAAYRSGSGKETNSSFADPRFSGTADLSFYLSAESPAVDSGTDMGFDRDLVGSSVPAGFATDRGALEAPAGDGGDGGPPSTPNGLRIVH